MRVLCDNDKKDIVKLLLSITMESEKKLTSLNQDKEYSKKQLEEIQKKSDILYKSKIYRINNRQRRC